MARVVLLTDWEGYVREVRTDIPDLEVLMMERDRLVLMSPASLDKWAENHSDVGFVNDDGEFFIPTRIYPHSPAIVDIGPGEDDQYPR